jgi:tRNA/tmRNA/rRNA uracil-C5-methylase (TrmA/RlmC/RlmD family)
LYSGVGLLGYALASLTPEALRLSAVESDENALGYVSGNLAGVAHVTPVAGRVDHWLRGHVRDVTAQSKASWALATVVLDPPRSGAKADVIHALAALGVRQIVYVACDPVALSRDAALLVAAGYDMTFLEAWDLFPHTHHMETVATFIRRDARS